MNTEQTNLCIIRKDLQDYGIAIAAGETYVQFIDEAQRIPYRWINEGTDEEQFQIFVDEDWHEACSIDFDFPG